MKIEIGSKQLLLSEIAGYADGFLIGPDRPVTHICTDSREADENTLFVALKGERVDGHDFFCAAEGLGCRSFLAERAEKMTDGSSCVIVENSEKALMKFARGYKKDRQFMCVFVTGSVGKTTTKEFISAVLSRRYVTHKTHGNFNSLIGMPLTVIETPKKSDVAVLEMAMSGLGEISKMSMAAEPDIAVITNIGSSHLEALGSRENIRRAKLEILGGLRRGGYAVINGDDPMLYKYERFGENTVYVGIKNSAVDYAAINIRSDGEATSFDVKTAQGILENIKIPVIGEHNVYAALIAIAIGGIMDMTPDEIREGLMSYVGVGLRQTITRLGALTVIEDCYNASPESMKAALSVLSSMRTAKGRTVALLGDMKELGVDSDNMHREVGRAVVESRIDILFTIGRLARNIAAGALDVGMNEEAVFVNVDEETYTATAWELSRVLRDGDVLLVKASRAIRAERVIEEIKKIYGTKQK